MLARFRRFVTLRNGIIFMVILAIFVGITSWFASAPTPPQDVNFNEVAGDRVLVIAPHPDDEVLGGGGVIQKAVASGKEVEVVVMTSGDGFKEDAMRYFTKFTPTSADYRRLGVSRHQESLNALKQLGVPNDHVIFLGYPDGGVDSLWGKYWDCKQLYHAINGYSYSPYSFSYEKSAPYCGENVVQNLATIIQEYQPTMVVYPDPHDQHPDHWATNLFTQYALIQQGYTGPQWTYLVHSHALLWPWKNSDLPPFDMKGLDIQWVYLSMSKGEQNKKWRSLQDYRSQTEIMDPWMKKFIRQKDLFEVYPIVTLPTVKNPIQFEQPHFIHQLYMDTENLTLLQRWGVTGGEIGEIRGARNGDQLYLGVKTKNPIQQGLIYHFQVIIFNETGERRLDATVSVSQYLVAKKAKKTLQLANDIDVRMNRDQVWIASSKDALLGARDIMLSVDVSNKAGSVERVAWRHIKVK